MTQKEALVKLFKAELSKCNRPIRMIADSGHFIFGCLFYPYEDAKRMFNSHKIGISEESMCIHFQGIMESLLIEEFAELKILYDNRINYIYEQEEIKKGRESRINITLLEELASKNDFDLSRRVLFEKRAKKDKFKF